MSIGFTLPFARSTGSVGYLDFTADELSAVRANLISLLVTNWGERVMHFDFGCNLREFIFENGRGSDMKQRIADRVSSQVERWMPFVGISVLNIIFPEEDGALPQNSIGVRIAFFVKSRPKLESVLEAVVN